MAIPSGLGTTFGLAKETTYGTAVTPTRYWEVNSEGLDFTPTNFQGGGLRGSGLTRRAARRTRTLRNGGGPTPLYVPTKGFGLGIQAMLGSSATATQQASTTAYRQVHTLGNTLPSFTLQKAVSRAIAAGTQNVYTFKGSVVTQWEISCTQGEVVAASLTWDSRDVDRDTSTAGTPSYSTTANEFSFLGGTLTVGGTATTASGEVSVSGGTSIATITGASVTGNNALKTDRNFFNSGGLKALPLRNDFAAIGGTLTGEYNDPADIVDAFLGDTSVSLHLAFQGSQISGIYYELLDIIIPAIRFDGELPKVGGPDVVSLSGPFTGLDDGTNTPIQIIYQSTDTAL